MDEFHRIRIPTPFEVGRVNCYALIGEGVAVVDPGPATAAAYDAFSTGLHGIGFDIDDVEQVLITHPHMDHYGLANRIVEESGARALAHRNATKRLADPDAHFEREQLFFRSFLQSMGVPKQVAETAIALPEAYRECQEPLSVDHELTDGDCVDVGVELTAVHTPGHAPGSVCFVSASENFAFTGDHVLQQISPNPLLTVAPGSTDERTRSLPAYLDSLARIADTGAEVGYGGHGERISDLNGRVEEILDHHNHRKERIAGLVEETGPLTAYDVMQTMFPDLPATEVFPGMSEILGHLDLLEDEGRVTLMDADGVRTYAIR